MFSGGIDDVKSWFEAGMLLRLENSIFPEGSEWFHSSAADHASGIAVLLDLSVVPHDEWYNGVCFLLLLTSSVNIMFSQLPTITEVY